MGARPSRSRAESASITFEAKRRSSQFDSNNPLTDSNGFEDLKLYREYGFLSSADVPRLYASLAVYGAFFAEGALVAALGVSIIVIANDVGWSYTDFSQLFTYRGIGFLLGAVVVTRMLETKCSLISKHLLCACSTICGCVAWAAVPFVIHSTGPFKDYLLRLVLLLQGCCLGGVEAFGITAISEMWGQRMQPWLQWKCAAQGFGAFFVPMIVNQYGYNFSFTIIACSGIFVVFGLLFERLHMSFCYTENVAKEKSYGTLTDDRKLSFTDEYGYDVSVATSGSHLTSHEIVAMMRNLNVIEEEKLQSEGVKDLGGFQKLHLLTHEMLERMETVVHYFDPRPHTRIHSKWYSVVSKQRGKTLAYATPYIVSFLAKDRSPDVGIVLTPLSVKFLMGLFMFWTDGLLFSYCGWITTYIQLQHINDANALVFVISLVYLGMFFGGFYAVTMSMSVTTTAMMRTQIFLLILTAFLLQLQIYPYTTAKAASFLMGFSLSCMLPLVVTLPHDYGCTIDNWSTLYVIAGGCCGQAAGPVLIGMLMTYLDYHAFSVSTGIAAVMMVLVYFCIHQLLTFESRKLTYDDLNDNADRKNSSVEEEVKRADVPTGSFVNPMMKTSPRRSTIHWLNASVDH